MILLKDPSVRDAQPDLGTAGNDKAGEESSHTDVNCERFGSAFVVRRSWKLLHLSALDCWILKEVSKALAREKPHLAYQPTPASS